MTSRRSLLSTSTFTDQMVPRVGVEPTWALSPLDFESSAYTNFATPACEFMMINLSGQ